MQGAKESAAAACVGALMLTCGVPVALAQHPYEISGELEASVTSRRLPSDDRYDLQTEVLAYTHVSTYLWQPWIATVSADLNASFETDNRSGFGEATSIGGDLLLSMLPVSRYPFQIFFSASNNRFDGDYSGLDYSRLRAGFSGRADFGDGVTLDYIFSHTEFDRVNYGNLSARRAEATLRRKFSPGEMPLNILDMGIAVNYYGTDFESKWVDDPGYSTESIAGTFFMRAAPTERVDHSFTSTLIHDRSGYAQGRFNRILGQTVGSAQWRSPSNDLTATSAVRMLFQEVDHTYTPTKADVTSGLIAANAGVNWRANDNLTMSLGGRASGERIGTFADETTSLLYEPTRTNIAGGLLGTIDYRSDTQQWSGFDWHWDARAVGDAGYDSNRFKRAHYNTLYGPHSDVSFIIGHTFERPMWIPWLNTVNASFLQETGFSHYSDYEMFRPVLTHSASFTKGFSGEDSSSYVRLYFRDTHSFGKGALEYQTAQLDFTRQVQLSGTQSLHGSLGAQAIRQSRYERDDFYIFSHADLMYEHNDWMGVEGLTFSSNLRINSIGLDDLSRDWRDDLTPDLFRNDWRNKVQYRIGQLSLSLEGTLFEEDGKLGHYVRFAGRRIFDYAD